MLKARALVLRIAASGLTVLIEPSKCLTESMAEHTRPAPTGSQKCDQRPVSQKIVSESNQVANTRYHVCPCISSEASREPVSPAPFPALQWFEILEVGVHGLPPSSYVHLHSRCVPMFECRLESLRSTLPTARHDCHSFYWLNT